MANQWLNEFQFVNRLPEGEYLSPQKLVFCAEKILCLGSDGAEKVIFSQRELTEIKLPQQQYFFGFYRNNPCFVSNLADEIELPEGYHWRSLRSLLGILPDAWFNWAGRARQVLTTYHNHQYCGCCGQPTSIVENEHARRCQSCELDFYSRIAPCVIMLITRGDHCLLARNAGWDSWFSALAGFIEPGETVEQAVRRETLEEVGLMVNKVTYLGSQPWPFPGQLMLGFHAEYESGEIIPEEGEIAEAGWYRYDNLPPHPDTRTLSGQLIKHFVDQF